MARKRPELMHVAALGRARWQRRQERLRGEAVVAPRRIRRLPRLSRRNSTGYKGVSPYRNGYQAAICHGGKRQHLGQFPTAREAALAYDRAALVLKGDRAVTNQALGLLERGQQVAARWDTGRDEVAA